VKNVVKVPENLVCLKSVFKTILSGTIVKILLNNFIFSRCASLFFAFKKYSHIFLLFFPFQTCKIFFCKKSYYYRIIFSQFHIFIVFYFHRVIL